MSSVQVDHFSDVLCIWAYVAQARIDELLSTFGSDLQVDYHFISIFGDTPGKLERQWAERGGGAGYCAHVRKVAADFEHVEVHPDVWARNAPISSMPCHLFLCAVKIAEERSGSVGGKFASACGGLREAFFRDLIDVSSRRAQFEIAEQLDLPVAAIESALNSGEAHATFAEGLRKAQGYSVHVSPSLVLDGGRQLLGGNVGYRVLEANVRELRESLEVQHSRC
jgi:predicted DsbA family dithiol-disulfide isomerase